MRRAIEFDAYAASMRPRAMSLSRRQARHHPFLDADDLLQEAMIALWSVWQKQPKKPLDELQKIGHVAMTRRLACVFQRQFRFGIARPTVPDSTHPDAVWDRGPWGQGKWIGPVTVTSLDAPVSEDSDTPLIELLPGTDGDGSALIDLERALSPDEQRVLRELLSPSRQTLMALRRRLRDMEKGGTEEPELATLSTCLGQVLQLTETFTRETLERIRLHVRGSQYIQRQTERNSQPTHKEVKNMDTKAAELGIDPGELVNPNGADGAVETEKPAKVTKAEKKAKAEKAPKPKAEKKVAEKAPKAKAEKKAAKPAKAKAAKKDGDQPSGGPYSNKAPKGLLEAGSFVKYKGGANLRNSWLKTGMVGRVFGFRLNKNGGARYCIRFEGGKGTIMSATHVEKAAAPAPKAKAAKAEKAAKKAKKAK